MESVGLRKCPYYRYLIEKVTSTDVRTTNISQSLPHKMTENSRYEEITSLSPYVYIIRVSRANFVKFGRSKIGEIARCLPGKKTKFRLALSLSLLHGSRTKSVRASGRQCTQCPKFHLHRLTSGRVIAERVNTVQTRDKVNPILGEVQAE